MSEFLNLLSGLSLPDSSPNKTQIKQNNIINKTVDKQNNTVSKTVDKVRNIGGDDAARVAANIISRDLNKEIQQNQQGIFDKKYSSLPNLPSKPEGSTLPSAKDIYASEQNHRANSLAGNENSTAKGNEESLSNLSIKDLSDKYGDQDGLKIAEQRMLDRVGIVDGTTNNGRSGGQILGDTAKGVISGTGSMIDNTAGFLAKHLVDPMYNQIERGFYKTAGVIAANTVDPLVDTINGDDSKSHIGNDLYNLGVNNFNQNTLSDHWYRDAAKITENMGELKSDPFKKALAARNLATQSNDNISKEVYDKDVEKYGKTNATINQIIRDTKNSLSTGFDNPEVLGDTIAEAAPSILAAAAGGWAIRGLSSVAGLAETLGISEAQLSVLAQSSPKLAKTLQYSKTFSSIAPVNAALEASAAEQQVLDVSDKLSDADLKKYSPKYNELLNQGLTPKQARTQLTSDTQDQAGLIAGAVGALTTPLGMGFEKAPFAKVPVGKLLMHGLGEGTEEATQGGLSQLGQNLAVQDKLDNRVNLADQVGQNIADSFVAGVGTVGVTQAPSGLGKGVKLGYKGVKAPITLAGKGIGKAANYVGELRAEKADAVNPNSNISVNEQINSLKDNVDILNQTKPEITNTDDDSSEKETPINKEFDAHVDYISNPSLQENSSFTEESLSKDFSNKKHIKALSDPNTNLFNKINYLTKILNNPKESSEDKSGAFQLLIESHQNISSFENYLNNNEDIKSQFNPDAFKVVKYTLDNLNNNKNFQESKNLVIKNLIDNPEQDQNENVQNTVNDIVSGKYEEPSTGKTLALFHKILSNVLQNNDNSENTDNHRLNSSLEALKVLSEKLGSINPNLNGFVSNFTDFVKKQKEFVNENKTDFDLVSKEFYSSQDGSGHNGLMQHLSKAIMSNALGDKKGFNETYEKILNFQEARNNKAKVLSEAAKKDSLENQAYIKSGKPQVLTYTSYNKDTGQAYPEEVKFSGFKSKKLVEQTQKEANLINKFVKTFNQSFSNIKADEVTSSTAENVNDSKVVPIKEVVKEDQPTIIKHKNREYIKTENGWINNKTKNNITSEKLISVLERKSLRPELFDGVDSKTITKHALGVVDNVSKESAPKNISEDVDNKKETSNISRSVDSSKDKHISPETDGVNHINIYTKGRTSLGKFLSNLAKIPVKVDGITFPSIENYYQYLKISMAISNKGLQEKPNLLAFFKKINPFEAKQKVKIINKQGLKSYNVTGKDIQDVVTSDAFRDKILNSIVNKIKANPVFLEEFKKNKLPLKHYFVLKGKVVEQSNTAWIAGDLYKKFNTENPVIEDKKVIKEDPQLLQDRVENINPETTKSEAPSKESFEETKMQEAFKKVKESKLLTYKAANKTLLETDLFDNVELRDLTKNFDNASEFFKKFTDRYNSYFDKLSEDKQKELKKYPSLNYKLKALLPENVLKFLDKPSTRREVKQDLDRNLKAATAISEDLKLLDPSKLKDKYVNGKKVLLSDRQPFTYYESVLDKDILDNSGQVVFDPEFLERYGLAAIEALLQTEARTSLKGDDDSKAPVFDDNVPDGILHSTTDLINNFKPVFNEMLKKYTTGKYNNIAQNQVFLSKLINNAINSAIKQGLVEFIAVGYDNPETGSYTITGDKSVVGNSKYFVLTDKLIKGNKFTLFPEYFSTTINDSIEALPVSIGKPATFSKTQRHLKYELSPSQINATKKLASTPHYIYTSFAQLFSEEEQRDNIIKFLLNVDNFDEKNYNSADFNSIKGKYTTAISGFNALDKVKFLQDSSQSDNKEIYYSTTISSNNRLEYTMGVNPQNSKIVREFITPIQHEIDLTKDNVLSDILFFTAQNIDLKTHNLGYEESVKQATAFVEKPEVVELLKNFTDVINNKGAINYDLVEKALGDIRSMRAFAGLYQYAELQNALQKGKTKAISHLYIEADGVTDGIANTLANLTTVYGQEFINNLAKVGGLPKDFKTLSDYRNSSLGDEKDYYRYIADNLVYHFKGKFGKLQSRFKSSKNNDFLGSNSSIRIISLTTGDISMEEVVQDQLNDLISEVSRSLVKNPVTTVSYGAGSSSTSDKILQTPIRDIYSKLSKVVSSKEITTDSIAKIFFPNDALSIAKEKLQNLNTVINENFYKDTVSHKDFLEEISTRKGAKEFEFSRSEMKAASENLEAAFTSGLVDVTKASISENAISNLENIRDYYTFKNLLQAASVENFYLSPDGKTVRSLEYQKEHSLADLENKISTNTALHPIIHTPSSSVYLMGKEKALENSLFSVRSPSDHDTQITPHIFNSDYQLPSVNLQGVSSQAIFNIANGDGETILNFYKLFNGIPHVLPIFDGVHMGLNNFREVGKLLNKAVGVTWTGNVYSKLLDDTTSLESNLNNDVVPNSLTKKELKTKYEVKNSFDGNSSIYRLLKKNLVEIFNLNKEESKDFKPSLENIKAAVLNFKDIFAQNNSSRDYFLKEFYNSGTQIEHLSTGIVDNVSPLPKPRYERIPKLSTKTDTMEFPFINSKGDVSGKIIENKITDGFLDQNFYRSGLHKDPAANLIKLFNKLGLLKDVRVYTVTDVNGKFDSDLSKKFILSRLKNNPSYEDIKTHLNDKISKGFTDGNNIYLINPSEETLPHELLHTALKNIISDYINNKITDSNINDKLQKIETLMDTFLNLKSSKSLPIHNVQNLINNFLYNNNKEAALHEFVAYGLTDPNVSETLQNRSSPFQRVLKQVKDTVFKLFKSFGLKAHDMSNATMYKDLMTLLSSAAGEYVRPNVIQNPINVSNTASTTNLVLHHSSFNESSDLRLESLQEKASNLFKDVNDILSSNKDTLSKKAFRNKLETVSQKFPISKVVATFGLNPQQKSAYLTLLSLMSATKVIDPKYLASFNKLFADIHDNMDLNQLTDSQKELLFYSSKDVDTNLANFVALSMTSNLVRDALSKIKLNKSEAVINKSGFDKLVDSIGLFSIDKLNNLLTIKGKKPNNYLEALDHLSDNLSLVSKYNQSVMNSIIESANNLGKNIITSGSKKLSELSDKGIDSENRVIKIISGIGKVTGELTATDSDRSFVLDTLNSWSNVPPMLRALAKDIVGRKSDNALIFDSKKRYVSKIQNLRENFRNIIPNKLISNFKEKPTKQQQEHLTNITFKSNLHGLMTNHSYKEIYEMISDPSILKRKHLDKQGELQKLTPNASAMMGKIDQLVKFIINGEVSNNLLRNPVQIAKMYGEKEFNSHVSEEIIDVVDDLISFSLLHAQTTEAKETFSSLYENDQKALETSLDYYKNLMKREFSKDVSELAQENYQVGYIPEVYKTGGKLIILDDIEAKEYLERSYQRVGDYKASTADVDGRGKGYYYSTIDDTTPLKQGLIQQIKGTYHGVNGDSGIARIANDGLIGGRKAKAIKLNINKGDNGLLLPIYNKKGEVVFYQRIADPNIEKQYINSENNFFLLNGFMAGRQVEEEFSKEVNKQILLNLKESYDKDPMKGNYVNILDPTQMKDPVYRSVISSFSKEFLATAMDVMQTDNIDSKPIIMVQRGMLDDVIGFNKASVGDAWTGNTRWNPEVAKVVKNLAIATMGLKGYKYLINSERFVQDTVSKAKETIIIRSGVVALSNHISNALQLLSRNVPATSIIKNTPKYINELNQYFKINTQIIDLELKKNSIENPSQLKMIDNQISHLNNSIKKLTISPLIEAGEIGSISDIGTFIDVNSRDGNIMQYFGEQYDKLPESIKQTFDYATIDRDSSLFRAMKKFNEYGDYVAKAIYFEHLLNKGLSEKEALGKVTEEFVNYDISEGRFREYLESMGLLWFYNFKLRILKIALHTLKENPVSLLMTAMLPIPSIFPSVGLPLTDNIVAKFPSLSYTMGWGFGMRGLSLHPTTNLIKSLF